jgi:hypothetical protein
LFAAGVVLYELLCDGEHPYANAQPAVDQAVRDPNEWRPELTDSVVTFLTKACAAHRDERFQTAAEMKNDLEQIRADL